MQPVVWNEPTYEQEDNIKGLILEGEIRMISSAASGLTSQTHL